MKLDITPKVGPGTFEIKLESQNGRVGDPVEKDLPIVKFGYELK